MDYKQVQREPYERMWNVLREKIISLSDQYEGLSEFYANKKLYMQASHNDSVCVGFDYILDVMTWIEKDRIIFFPRDDSDVEL